MICPSCNFTHTERTGRLAAAFPTFGVRKVSGGVGVSGHPLRPGYYVAKERSEKIEAGNVFVCLMCGNQIGLDSEGIFVPRLQPIQAQQQTPPANGRRERTISEVTEPADKPLRPVHLPDSDLAEMPEIP
jgi:hypothetical protein